MFGDNISNYIYFLRKKSLVVTSREMSCFDLLVPAIITVVCGYVKTKADCYFKLHRGKEPVPVLGFLFFSVWRQTVMVANNLNTSLFNLSSGCLQRKHGCVVRRLPCTSVACLLLKRLSTLFFFSRVCQHSAQCGICTNIYIHRNQPVPCCSDTLLMVKHCRDWVHLLMSSWCFLNLRIPMISVANGLWRNRQ